MRTLSILLPFRGKAPLLEATLVSLLENRPEFAGVPAEIVVVLGDEYDDPYDLAGEVTFVVARKKAPWVESVNLGLERCQGAIVHVLSCGVEASEGWADAAQGAFDDPQVAAVAPVAYDRIDRQRVISAGLRYRRGGGVQTICSTKESQLARVTAPSPLAGFYRRTALLRLGGFPTLCGDSLATVDLTLRMAAVGYRTVVEPESVVYVAQGAAKPAARGYRTGLGAERLFWRHLPQRGVALSYVAHAASVLAETIFAMPRPSTATTLLGRSAAWRERHELQDAARRLTERGHEATPPGGHSTQELLHMHRPCATSRVA